MDVEKLAKELILKNMTPEQQMAVLEGIKSTVAEAKEVQKRKIGENVDIVVQALKKIEADIRSRYDDVGNAIEKRVASIKDGRDGINGKDGRDGKDGKAGRDGAKGDKGDAGRDGRDGVDGVDGVSVTSARIDFDGSLVIVLSSGVELNVGEVVAPDLAERIKVITNGGGTSQSVLDTLASLQTQINNLIPSQTGNAGKYLTTNGTALSWATVSGSGLTYQGTWNASTNTPTLASSTGSSGYYYIVSVAGSTNLDGITDWQAGDWLVFNGTVWQKIDQSWATAGANDNITSMTGITGGISSPDFIQFDTAASNTNAVGKLYWDSTQKTLSVGLTADIAADVGQTLYAYVTNAEATTITKGQAVYMYAAQGDRVSVKLAYNTGDATSAKTLGLCAEDIASGQAGMVLCQGVQDGLNLGSYAAGDTLYLGSTAGSLTSTKPYAPNHLVYIGVVERANSGNGRLYVRVQNGYEMDELHNVSAQNPTNGQVLIYNESTSLWEKHTLTDGTGISITEGAGSITINNTGVTSAVAGTGISVSGATGAVTITNSAPDQTVALTSGTGISTSGTYPNFTISNTGVTSVGVVAPVATTGGATPTISLASGYGDTLNPYASKTANYVLAAPNGSAGVPTFRAIVAADIPTLNQSTTGSAATLTTPRAIYGNNFDGSAALTQVIASTYGGTGNGFTKFSGATTAERTYTLPDATTTILTTNAAVTVDQGGTGQTSYTDGQLLIGNSTGNTLAKSTLTAGSGITITNGSGAITIAASGGSGVTSVTGTSPVVSSGGTTPAISLASGYGDTQNPYASKTANYFLSAPNGSSGVPTFRAIVAADIPTLNQNTTGTAGSLSTASGSAPSYSARAWVNFNGTGTVAIRASGNVTSITDNGTGDYTVNFTTAMSDANYCVSTGYRNNSSSYTRMGGLTIKYNVTPTTSALRVETGYGDDNSSSYNNQDYDYCCLSIFR